jgi:hypothetical protein
MDADKKTDSETGDRVNPRGSSPVNRCETPRMPGQRKAWPRSWPSLLATRVGQMDLVAVRKKAGVSWNLDVMAIRSRQSDETEVDAVVVEADPHNPSLTRSSVGRGRGLPLWRIAGRSCRSLRPRSHPFDGPRELLEGYPGNRQSPPEQLVGGFPNPRAETVTDHEGCVVRQFAEIAVDYFIFV